MSRRNWNYSAFTLIELLVGMAISMLVMGACYGGLRTVLAAREKLVARSELFQAGRRALDEIAAAFRSARAVGNLDIHLIGRDGEFEGAPDDSLTFYTVTDRPARFDQPESDLYEIAFIVIRDEETGEGALWRRKDPGVDDEMEDGGILTEIAHDVVALNVEYFDGLDWLDAWLPEEAIGMPASVRVTIALTRSDSPGQTLTLTTTVSPLVTAGAAISDDETG